MRGGENMSTRGWVNMSTRGWGNMHQECEGKNVHKRLAKNSSISFLKNSVLKKSSSAPYNHKLSSNWCSRSSLKTHTTLKSPYFLDFHTFCIILSMVDRLPNVFILVATDADLGRRGLADGWLSWWWSHSFRTMSRICTSQAHQIKTTFYIWKRTLV